MAQDAKGSAAHIKAVTSAVDGNWIKNNAATSKDWPAVGLDYAETRFSKLDQINAGNVKDLGLAWSYDLESARGVEATPLVVDGIMYVSASWSVVHAIDVRTGKRIWTFDPEGGARAKGYKGCCDVVNRGVALHKGKVYVGAYDGRLIALDAATGKKVWEKDTIIDRKQLLHDHRRAARLQGQGDHRQRRRRVRRARLRHRLRRRDRQAGLALVHGARRPEQALRGRVRWRRPPRPGTRPASTGKTGGGGTAWDTHHLRSRPQPRLSSAPATARRGTRNLRSPAGGDNLYLASIVALNADTGKYVWHYQETPGDNWDYTSTQPMILADLTIDGAAAQGHPARAEERLLLRHRPHQRQVHLGQELRRRELGHRLRRQRPADRGARGALDRTSRSTAFPAPIGAHNWHPMSFNPQTGLVYLPAQNMPLNLTATRTGSTTPTQPGESMRRHRLELGYAINADAAQEQASSAG